MWAMNRAPIFFYILAVVLVSLFANCRSDSNVTTHDPNVISPNVTTVEPNTTTSAPLTTVLPPGPAKKDVPPVLTYNILGSNKTLCLMAKLAVQFEITYNNSGAKSKEEHAYMSIKTGKVLEPQSVCGENETTLVIEINGDEKDTLEFLVIKEKDDYYVKHVALNLDSNTTHLIMPDASPSINNIKAELNNGSLFKAPDSKSYKCNAEAVKTMDSGNSFAVKMILKDVQFDAFRHEAKDTFRTAKRCSADDEINDIIPIAVGAALAALVVIVLIAYFIGRRRSRRLAYQSV